MTRVRVSRVAQVFAIASALVSAAFPRAPDTRREVYNWIATTATVLGCLGILWAAVVWFGSAVDGGDKWREFGAQVLQALVPGCFFLVIGVAGHLFVRRVRW
jgi:hypothetical protein